MLDILFWGFLGYTFFILILMVFVADLIFKATKLIFQLIVFKIKERRYVKRISK